MDEPFRLNTRPGTSSVIMEVSFLEQKRELHKNLIRNMDFSVLGTMPLEQRQMEVRKAAETLCEQSLGLLSLNDRERLINEIVQETFGLGPLEPLINDPTISDIMINGAKTVYVEQGGRLKRVPVVFDDDLHLIQIVQRIISQTGRHVDERSPLVDARLPDGSRINAVLPPIALDGSLVSIRRFGNSPMKMENLIAKNSITQDMADFLSACIKARLNVIISGGTGSGKTTLLNALSASIPVEERVVTIEDAAELRLQQPHVARMETRHANTENVGEITTRDLVRNALRMRPDRIVVGECRGPEALDMLQAMNTGHDGSMTTIHSNSTRDAISRLEMMVGMTGVDLPIWMIRRQICSAVHVIVQVARTRGGARRVTRISEVTGMDGEIIGMQDLFGYKKTGIDESGNCQGHFYSTGLIPNCMEELESAGIVLPLSIFDGWVSNG